MYSMNGLLWVLGCSAIACIIKSQKQLRREDIVLDVDGVNGKKVLHSQEELRVKEQCERPQLIAAAMRPCTRLAAEDVCDYCVIGRDA